MEFDVRSPKSGGSYVQFGVHQHMSAFQWIPTEWTTVTISFASLGLTPSELANVHLPFTVGANDHNASKGAVVLLDNIRFLPVPASQESRKGALSLPVGYQSFGDVLKNQPVFPPDQVNRNLADVYQSSLVLMALLRRGAPTDLQNARLIADAFDYALFHDNHGNPLPKDPGKRAGSPGCYDGDRRNTQCGLHNAYSSGDIALFNSQGTGQGLAGDVRLAGFTCGISPTGYCVILDGATGGNNAFAMLALLAAYDEFKEPRYLQDARIIGRWIAAHLQDTTGTGYGGYYLGYPDEGAKKELMKGKSIENNADIYAAFTRLAGIEEGLGNLSQAKIWTNRANFAGDFVMRMFDSNVGRFCAGTVPTGTSTSPGICPDGPQKGDDIINTCDFLDSDSFTVLAMAKSKRYKGKIDWKRPVRYLLGTFPQRVTTGGEAFCGFNIVEEPTSGPNGVAWEFTGQAVVASKFVGVKEEVSCSGEPPHSYMAEIRHAQISAPFGNGKGIVASTLQDGDLLPPIAQCLATPFQCIPERVGLAATTWAIFAEKGLNIFSP